MQKPDHSVTALITAYMRAYHSKTTNKNERIFDDFLADDLFSEREKAFFGQALKVLSKVSSFITLIRSRYAEEVLKKSIAEKDIKQYVILGAGFDTFAFREKKLAKSLQIFEVDLKATQQEKIKRIKNAGWEIPDNLHFVTSDFTNENLEKDLEKQGYNPNTKSFYSLLGVTYYLPKKSVLKILEIFHKITSKGSVIVFDYLDEDAFNPDTATPQIKRMREMVERSGEPMMTGLSPANLGNELDKIGLKLAENNPAKDIEEIHIKNNEMKYSSKHFHFAMAVNG